jgi:signal transduction histidine kinase
MYAPPDRQASPVSRDHTPWVVLAAALLFTAAASLFLTSSIRERDAARFANAVESAHDRVVGRLDIYLATLQGAAALFSVMDTVTAERFREYVASLEVQERYPGIQGIGWTERLKNGIDGEVDEQHMIRYLEPLDDRNAAALGFDMYSEERRRAAMQRARDGAEPALSGMVTLRQEIFGRTQPGFLLYVPVYRGSTVPTTVAGRRAALLGFVYSPFRADDLFVGVFGTEEQPRVHFTVYAAARPDPYALLHASPRTAGHRSRFIATRTMDVAGQPWTVVFGSEPAFEAASGRVLVGAFVLTGMLASFWLFSLARGQRRAREAAEAANRAKSAFLASMSHELRTPLNAIAGYVELLELEQPGPVNDIQRGYLARVRRAQQHLLGLINNVLNFARIEAGSVRIEREPVSVGAAMYEADTMLAAQVAAAKLTYHRRGGPDVVVLADPEKLRQILINLLSNAIKFTEPGGTIVTWWQEEGSFVAIVVRDTGIGIPADRLEDIFDPFVQVDADLTRTRQGTGLGLSISRELARAMDGDIRVESGQGGSTFTLLLPLAEEGGAASSPHGSAAELRAAPAPADPGTILHG